METVDRRKMALQLAAALCLIAAPLHFMGGFPIASVGYAVSAGGLFQQARSRSHWGAVVARILSGVSGLINLTYAWLNGSDAASLLNNLTWLTANALIFLAAHWGSQTREKSSSKSIGIF